MRYHRTALALPVLLVALFAATFANAQEPLPPADPAPAAVPTMTLQEELPESYYRLPALQLTPKEMVRLNNIRRVRSIQQRMEAYRWAGYSPHRPTWATVPMTTSPYSVRRVIQIPVVLPRY